MINLGKHWQTLKKLYSATVNKNTAITAGGLAAAVAVPYLANSLSSAEINFGFSRDNLERIGRMAISLPQTRTMSDV